MEAHHEINTHTDYVVKQPEQPLVNFGQQADDKTPSELSNTTGTQLQHMNEDCLLEIFSSKSLTPMDLCSLAETCTRFVPITRQVFPKQFTIDDYYYRTFGFDSKDHWRCKKRPHNVERIFKNFGSCISEFAIDVNNKEFNVVNLLTKYCVGTLKRLRIERMQISEVHAVKLKPIFQQLQRLDLHRVTIEGDRNVFANCDSLTELEVTEVANCVSILENIFPKLERFGFDYYNDEDELNKFEYWSDKSNFDYELCVSVFISRHERSLKILNLVIDSRVVSRLAGRTLQIIGENCKELEELVINITPENENYVFALHALDQLNKLKIRLGRLVNATNCILNLRALKSLETLKIRQDGWTYFDIEFIPALALLTNLRELHLIGCYSLRDLSQLTLLTQLTKLCLDTIYITDVVDIIRRLTNLEELTIDGRAGPVLCDKSFSEIVEIVKGRPHVLTLKCKFNFFFNSKNCDENQNVKLIKM